MVKIYPTSNSRMSRNLTSKPHNFIYILQDYAVLKSSRTSTTMKYKNACERFPWNKTPYHNIVFELLTSFENSEKDDKCRTICQIRKQITIEATTFMRIMYETDIIKQQFRNSDAVNYTHTKDTLFTLAPTRTLRMSKHTV
jgi:hypothetical protein